MLKFGLEINRIILPLEKLALLSGGNGQLNQIVGSGRKRSVRSGVREVGKGSSVIQGTAVPWTSERNLSTSASSRIDMAVYRKTDDAVAALTPEQ